MLKKNKTAILTPEDFEMLKEGVPKEKHQIMLDVMLYSGMRYSELGRLDQSLFEPKRKSVYLSKEIDRKVKRISPGRYVHLSNEGVKAFRTFFHQNIHFPVYVGMDVNLRRWCLEAGIELPVGSSLGVKAFRKTWECWLAVTFSTKIPLICMSQGHTEAVAIAHYLNLPFTCREKNDMFKYVRGWLE